MNKFTILVCISIIMSGCVGYPVTLNPDLAVVLYDGDGENVEVFWGEIRIIKLHDIKTDENNVAAVVKVKRIPGKINVKVRVNGKTAGCFSINAQQIGVAYLFLTPEGSVVLEDGMKIR